MLTIEKLIDYGADVKAGMEICMNNEEFYFRMINLMLADNQVENLQRAVEEGNLDEAFEAAHALKGVTANLGLTPIRTHGPIWTIRSLWMKLKNKRKHLLNLQSRKGTR